MNNKPFWRKLREYFAVYLPKQKNSSQKTIDTCHKAWNMLLRYVIRERNIPVGKVDYKTFTRELVTEFLDFMESQKNWKPSTRNNRLSCIRSFFKFASWDCPEAYIVYADLGMIPMKKGIDNSRVIKFVSEDALYSIVSCIDDKTKKGLRDKFFLTIMYDTAGRNSEILNLKLCDIHTENETVILFGKGSKPRLVPLSKETLDMFKKYKKVYHPNSTPSELLFYTNHKGSKTIMSDDNVARFLTVYANKAHELNDSVPKKIHPHMIRHSRAMHLYKGGMPLSVLSEFLGHENPETTLIYAYADTEMKREAIEKASKGLVLPNINADIPIWEDTDIIKRLIRGY